MNMRSIMVLLFLFAVVPTHSQKESGDSGAEKIKEKADKERGQILFMAYSSTAMTSYSASRQVELGQVTQGFDRREKYLFNVIKRYKRIASERGPDDLTLDQLIKKLKGYIKRYEKDATIYKVRLLYGLFLIERAQSKQSLGRCDRSRIAKQLEKSSPRKTWPFFYRAIHTFLRGWQHYRDEKYAGAKKYFSESISLYPRLDVQKRKFMDNYRAYSLYAAGDCAIQLGETKSGEMPPEWQDLKSVYPQSPFVKAVDRILRETK